MPFQVVHSLGKACFEQRKKNAFLCKFIFLSVSEYDVCNDNDIPTGECEKSLVTDGVGHGTPIMAYLVVYLCNFFFQF